MTERPERRLGVATEERRFRPRGFVIPTRATAAGAPGLGGAAGVRRPGSAVAGAGIPDPRVPVLALHGFTGSSATWDDLARDLALAGFLVLAPTLPGHGSTRSHVTPTIPRTATALAGLAGAPAHVIGYSLGARIALQLAIAHPDAVRRLVLEAPSAGLVEPAARAARRAADEELARLLELDGLTAFLDAWERQPVIAAEAGLSVDVRMRQRAIRESHEAAGLATSLRAAGQGAMRPLQDRLAAIAAPTLVIVGASDPARPRAEEVARSIPRARLAVVPQAGHAVHLHQPEAFVALVRDFLEEPSS